jgi:L-fuconolactonase
MYKLDSHHHCWIYNPVEYGWIDDKMAIIRRDFLPGDLEREFSAAGIHAAISVQARQTLEETRWLLELAQSHDFIQGVVGWVPLINPRVGAQLERLAENPKLRAVRHVLQDEPDGYMLRDDFNRGIREVTRLALAYDVLIFERQLPTAIQFVDLHPNQTFIVDHLAKPPVKRNELSPWHENLKDLARRPNVYCKLSGLATEAEHANWTPEQLSPYIDAVIEIFSPQRVMFGSDWPVCLLAIEYTQWAALVSQAIRSLSSSEQARIWSGTALEAYRIG